MAAELQALFSTAQEQSKSIAGISDQVKMLVGGLSELAANMKGLSDMAASMKPKDRTPSMEEAKAFQKLETFDGTTKTAFIPFAKKIRSLSKVHHRGVEHLNKAQKSPDPVTWSDINETAEAKIFNDDLNSVLLYSLKGEAAAILATQEEENGMVNAMEAWRQLYKNYHIQNESHDLVDITEILEVKESKTLEETRHNITIWESNLQKMSHEARSNISEAVRRSVLLKMTPKADRISIERSAVGGRMRTYAEVREQINRLADIDARNTKKAGGTKKDADHKDSDAMDVDPLQSSGGWDAQAGGDLNSMMGKGGKGTWPKGGGTKGYPKGGGTP